MPATGESDFIEDVVYEPATYIDAIASSSDEEVVGVKDVGDSPVKSPVKSTYTSKTATSGSTPVPGDHEEFIKKSVELLLKQAVFDSTNRKSKVLEFKTPDQLKNILDFDISNHPSTHENLLKLLQQVIRFSVKTGHPYFVNQLFSSLDPYGLIGQWLTDALNPSVYTYEVSPVFTLMEEVVLKEMRKFVGFVDGKGDGIFCPGGSMANGYAINCARYKYLPDIKVGFHLNSYMLLSNLEIE